MATLWRVLTRWSGLPQGEGLTVSHFTAGGGDASDASTDMAAFWTAMKPRISAAISWTMADEVLQVESDDGEILGSVGVTPASSFGTNAGQRLPGQAQGMAQLRTGVYFEGRRLQGRMFLPGPVEEESIVDGVPSGAYTLGVNTALATLVGSADSSLVVWHRPQPERPKRGGGTLPAHPGAFAVVSSAVCKPSWATLRGRGYK